MTGSHSRPDGKHEDFHRRARVSETFRNTAELFLKLSQIEANLDEQFHRTLRELESLQAARKARARRTRSNGGK